MDKKLIYGINDKPKTSQLIAFAIQQVLAILAATIAVPTIIGLPSQIPSAILGAGIGTLVYQIFTRFKSPVFLGSSFSFLSSLLVAVAYGYCGILIGSVIAGLVYVIIALIIHFTGTSWVDKFMPPVIIGPTVALIGLSLAGAAMGDIVKANDSAIYGDYNLVGLLCGLITFLVVVICSTQKKHKMPRLIPFIIGISAGYVLATIFTLIGTLTKCDYLMIINFQPIYDNFFNAEGAFKGFEAFITLPKFATIGAVQELTSGNVSSEIVEAVDALIKNESIVPPITPSVITLSGLAEVIIAFLPVALVVFAEHIADHKNLSSIVDKDLLKDPGLSKTLLGDGVGSMIGTIFGICPNTTYGESVGCVAITRNASVITITVTAFMCIFIYLFSGNSGGNNASTARTNAFG